MLSRPVPLLSLFGLLVLVGALGLHVSAFIQRVYASPEPNLLVFAEAPSFARIDDIDPSGWFYQAVLYNPTDFDVTVTGLRWWYNSTENFIEDARNARCYDSRYFSFPPSVTGDQKATTWEYLAGSISLTVPAREIVVTWIEVPTRSVKNGETVLVTYYVQAYEGSQWISSPLYTSHAGGDNSVATVFRSDFDLATHPDDESQSHPNPQWLFNENRAVIAETTKKVRVIPIASGKTEWNGIDYATINITFPSGWRYVPNSSYNPHDESITYYSVDGKDRLKWNLDNDVLVYSSDQSMSQNYIEFNITTPATLGLYNFTISSLVTSLGGVMTVENQFVYVNVKSPPKASFTYSPETLRVNETVTFNASTSYDPDGNIVSYIWDYGDGFNETGMIVKHAYTMEGNYTVTLTVTDDDGFTDSYSKLLKITSYPVAAFTYSPSSPLVNHTVTFNASSSTPDGGTIVSYFWNFGDGTNINETNPITYHTYNTTGTFTVTLNVTDSEGLWDTESKFITVRKYPIASFTFFPEAPLVNESVTFDASLSTPDGGTIISYIWDFGDGANGTGVIITHTYASVGRYNVSLTVIDNDGHVGSTSHTLTVYIHDLAIVTVTPSATEIYIGQVVNVTVIVKNEGNFTETFNVTLYCDKTAIGIQTVTDLEPGAEITLKFSWDTTGMIPDVSYTIKAQASLAAGETDTVDNTFTYDNVRVKSRVTSQPFDWSPILPYLIPILLGVLGFVVLGIVRKKREVGQGFKFFNEMTDGGIPDAYSVMIIGGAGSGKSVLCQRLAYDCLTQGKSCVYVTYDTFPSEVRQNMKNFQWNISAYEKMGTLKFVDCYSSIAGLSTGEGYCVEQPFALSDLGIDISTAMEDVEHKPTRVFLDSTAPLFARVDASEVIQFLQDRSARIKGDNGSFFFTVGEGTVPSDLMRRLEEIVDCIIELDVHEEKGKTLRKMRIKKLRGRRLVHGWIFFKIESRKGLTFLPPKSLSKSRID
jgi:KaiC/GvpD/RAD55 family RecA-like ATPase/PKD repeat protein